MRIAVSASGPGLDAPVDTRFGRAPWFVVVDTETLEARGVKNGQNPDLPQGAGIQAGKTVVETGASALVTGHCGPKAYRVLSSSGVALYLGARGTVRETVEAFRQGKLSLAEGADVEGHWV